MRNITRTESILPSNLSIPEEIENSTLGDSEAGRCAFSSEISDNPEIINIPKIQRP